MPWLLELFARQRGDFRVFGGQNLVEHLDDRNLGAHRPIERRKLDSDSAGADDQERIRNSLRNHRLEIRPDAFAVGLEARQNPRARAGRDDDVIGRIFAGAQDLRRAAPAAGGGSGARRRNHFDLSRRCERRFTPDDRDVVFLQQAGHAPVQALRNIARALHDGFGVEPHIVGGEAKSDAWRNRS